MLVRMLGLGGTTQGLVVAQRAVLADHLPEALPANSQQKTAEPGRTALFVVGAVLLALFAAAVVVGLTRGTETTKTGLGGESRTTTTSTTSGAKEEAKSATTGSKEEPRTTTNGTVTVTPKSQSTEVGKSAPSEDVLLALLSTGAVLILAGGMYKRLTAIKLPGGVEMTLSADESEKVQKAVADGAKAVVGAEAEPDPTQVAKAAVVAHAVAQAHKQATGEALSDEIVKLAAKTGLKAAGLE